MCETNGFCNFVGCKFVIANRGTGQRSLTPPLQGHPQTKVFCKNVVLQFERLRHMLLHACSVVLYSGLSLVSGSEAALLLAAGESLPLAGRHPSAMQTYFGIGTQSGRSTVQLLKPRRPSADEQFEEDLYESLPDAQPVSD